ncbi:salicylate synthetase [Emericellopsis atlantica]|uniref:Salicylate synthetase n=1 Tax=Emericellopsis atlantica TaxID=2614577 RepID=A0A9P8CKN5_9HYPO|nr:salicylate synthetase [Emericellopsis atlantica]KAG9250125.1 salicylate synthetase [Emericellopsis atlantica]
MIETIPRSTEGNTSVELVVDLVLAKSDLDYYVYERNQSWHIGLGVQSSLVVGSTGKLATFQQDDVVRQVPISSTLEQMAREFVADNAHAGFKVFGYVGYNYASHVRGTSYSPGRWPLLHLVVPRYQITVGPDEITVQGEDDKDFHDVVQSLKSTHIKIPPKDAVATDVLQGAARYTEIVNKALSKIKDRQITKVIVSRTVDLPTRVDMLAALLVGRKSNTPKRSFSFSYSGYQSTGFSPELVLSVVKGKVTTEPLAGTRARCDDRAECERLKKELESDPKEIVEHIVSVKEAIAELERVCCQGSVVVEDLMSVRTRGKVQHLGSAVAGKLQSNKDVWDALNVLFPSITASGIPKQAALKVIGSLESSPRELYSGGIIMMDPASNDFEATLVLRSVFQDQHRQWIQAGAGVISQSHAEREFTETCEKLATIAPFLRGE